MTRKAQSSERVDKLYLDIVEAVVQPTLDIMEIVVQKSLDIVETVVQQEGYFNERRL